MRFEVKRPSPAMVVALAAFFVALSAGAYAVTKAPKNSVVSKSIKNGQVKGVDLARGGVQFMSTNGLPTAGNEGQALPPVGLLHADDAGTTIGAELFAPVALTVGDFHVASGPQQIGQARRFTIRNTSTSSNVVACTVIAGNSTCASNAKAKIPAGDFFMLLVQNGPGGATGESAQIAYTLKPK